MSVDSVLIYCPNTGGHRHIYAKAFADYFLSQNAKIIFAHCGLLVGGRKIWPFVPHESSFLASIARHRAVTMLSLEGRYDPNKQAQLICALQNEYQISKTVIIDGDVIQWQLAALALPWKEKFSGATVAVFLFSEFIHPGAVPLGVLFKQWLLHAWLFRCFRILTSHIWTDEILVKSLAVPHYAFFPDIICEPDADILNGEDEAFTRRIFEELGAFLQRNTGKKPILIFGDWEPRKGNEMLYKLVQNNHDLVLVRVGRIKPGAQYTWDFTAMAEAIFKQGRLLEVPCYVESPRLIDKLFDLIKIMVIPYRKFYRTSAGMLLAVSKGKPVLTPNIGLLRHRTINHGLGMIFTPGEYESLAEKYYALVEYADEYSDNLQKYAKTYSSQALANTLDAIFNGQIVYDSCYFDGLPKRSLIELLHYRLRENYYGLSQAVVVFRKIQAWLNKMLVQPWKIWRYEEHARRQWQKLTGRQIVIYGAGKHTAWLQDLVAGLEQAPKVVAVVDDYPQPKKSFFNREVTLPDVAGIKSGYEVLLSSDTHQCEMALRAKAIFGSEVSLIDLYADLPSGPYPKRKT